MSGKMVDMVMMLVMIGGGYWLYSTGKLDELFKKKEGGGGDEAAPCDCAGAKAAEQKETKKSKIAYAWSAQLGDYVAYSSKKKKDDDDDDDKKKDKKDDKKKDDKDPNEGKTGSDPADAAVIGDPCAEQCKSTGTTKTKAGSSEANLVAIAAAGENVWQPTTGRIKFKSFKGSMMPAGNPITNTVFPNRKNHSYGSKYDTSYGLMNLQ